MSLPGLKRLEDSPNCIFFEKPSLVVINTHSLREENVSYKKIEDLICQLRETGPCLAYGTLDPNLNVDLPLRLSVPFHGKYIYVWEKGRSSRQPTPRHFLVLGAEKKSVEEYVYFTPTLDITPFAPSWRVLASAKESSPCLDSYYPSPKDEKIYMASLRIFRESIHRFYPPVPMNIPLFAKPIPFEDQEELERRFGMILPSSLFPAGITEDTCKQLAQAAYEESSPEKVMTHMPSTIPDTQEVYRAIGQSAFGGTSCQISSNQLWSTRHHAQKTILWGDSIWWTLPEEETSTEKSH